MKLLHVEDHPIVAQGIRHCLYGIADLVNVSTGKEALETAANSTFDGYIVDIDLPDMDGFSLMEEIRLWKPDALFVVCTMHDEIWLVRKLLLCGVDGVILKSEPADILTACIRTVFENGRQFFSPHFERIRQKALRLQRNELLSERELQVLRLVAQGENTQEIAGELSLSENTVETHRRHIITKLDARNIAEAVSKAYKMGILKK